MAEGGELLTCPYMATNLLSLVRLTPEELTIKCERDSKSEFEYSYSFLIMPKIKTFRKIMKRGVKVTYADR